MGSFSYKTGALSATILSQALVSWGTSEHHPFPGCKVPALLLAQGHSCVREPKVLRPPTCFVDYMAIL